MSSVGPQNPTAAASNNHTAGKVAWANPTNIFANDGNYAIASPMNAGNTTDDLDASGFDFSAVPSGATINGVVVEVDRVVTSTTGSPHDLTIRLLLASVVSGNNKASATTWPTTDAYATYGTSSDLWGLSLADTDVKNSGFGVRVTGIRGAGKGSTAMKVNHVRITVFYTAASGGGFVSAWATQSNTLIAGGPF